jgi:hypothetical protein
MRAVLSLALVLLGLGSACRHRVPSAQSTTPADGTVTIRIVNHNPLDMTLYVLHDSYRDRLGTVVAATTTDFELRLRTLGAGRVFQLLADPVGGREPTRSEMLHVQDGQLVTWTLETDLRRSTVTVF